MQTMTALTQQLSEPVTVRLVKTEADYEAAVAELDSMVGHVEAGTADGNRYELLAALVEAYEAANYPIAPSDDPVATIAPLNLSSLVISRTIHFLNRN